MKKGPQQKKPLDRFIRLTGVGLQMGITIYLAAYFGKKIDAHYGFEKNYVTLVFILIGFIGALVSLMVQLKRINDKEE
jgi:membrane protein DedA with SNARE-associated domain